MKILGVIILAIGIYNGYSVYNNHNNSSLLGTQPAKNVIREENNTCSLSTGKIETKIFGLSDPSFLDDKVQYLAAELGTKWVRADFRWDDIQLSNDSYDFSKYDDLVKNMRKNNIKMVGIINNIPSKYHDWNSINLNYEKFIKTLFLRYKDDIVYWEIFNEPNLPGFGWLSQKANAHDYIQAYSHILYITNTTLRSINPDGFLILGGLSSSGEKHQDFLQSLYDLNSRKCFDIIGFHPYGYEGRFKEAVKEFRAIEAKNNDANKPVWFTEYGSPDENNKLALLKDVIKQRNDFDTIFWFSIKDFSPINNFYGMVNYKNQKKDIFYDFKNLTH